MSGMAGPVLGTHFEKQSPAYRSRVGQTYQAWKTVPIILGRGTAVNQGIENYPANQGHRVTLSKMKESRGLS